MRKDWYKESFVYHTYPLGMCGCPENNSANFPVTPRLEELFDWIDYWKYLGINTIYFGPIFESTSHGYDTIDYYNIDRRLGDNNLFASLVKTLNQSGIRTIVDGVFNHVSREFFAFQDVLKHGQNSMFCSWFYLDFNRGSSYGDPFYYEGWEGHYNLVKLNLQNYYVKEYLFNAVRTWIEDFDISGLRLDVAYTLDENFIRELRQVCLEIKPDFWLLGEMIHGDYKRLLAPDKVDSVTNYECYKSLFSSYNDANFFEISHSINRQIGRYGIYKGYTLYNFVDNHDVDRLASVLKNKNHLYPLYLLYMTMPSIPSIYYGSELGIEGKKTNGSDKPLRPRLSYDDIQKLAHENDLLKHIKRMSDMRVNNKTLIYGEYDEVYTNNKQLAFSRSDNDEFYLITLNMDDEDIEIPLNNLKRFGYFIDILNNDEKFYITQNDKKIPVYKNWGRILKFQKTW